MPTPLNILIVFSLIAGANLMVLVAILFFRKNNTLSNKALGMLILIAGLALILNPVVYVGGFYNHPFLLKLTYCTAFFFGPTLLLYLHLMEGNVYQFKKSHLIHFIPIPIVIAYGVYMALQPNKVINDNYLKVMSGEDLVTNLIYLSQLFHFAIYITWGIRKVKRYGMVIENYLSTYEDVNYQWLWFFVTRLLIINVLLIVVYVVQLSFFPSYAIYSELLATPLAASCFYPMVFYKSLSNHLIFDKTAFMELVDRNNLLLKTSPPIEKGLEKKEEPDNIERLLLIKKELDKQLEENEIYRKPQLSIQQLADEIGCGRTLLSQTINHLYGLTFFELINNYRVEEAKKLLVDPNYFYLKIESIGEMTGFSSRTSFFSVFKKVTKLSPSKYRKQEVK